MKSTFFSNLDHSLQELKESGLYKTERVIASPQQSNIQTASGQTVINLCANNYLGLANNVEIVKAAEKALEDYGYGMSSVRFICGTQTIHKQLEQRLSDFLKMEDTILYSSCFDANTGLFETILSEEDAVISDALNHASIIDGIRLCKAKRFRYENNNMDDLEEKLKAAASARVRLIATDGVFSMDGTFANLPVICDLAEKYDALVMVDDSHAVGFIGKEGRGTHEYWKVMNRVHIITGTLGKALGGASGGYTSGRREIVEWLRQRSRPYLFSNSLAPMIAATSLRVLDLVQGDRGLQARLLRNTDFFRKEMTRLGFEIIPGTHPIVPIMLGDAKKSGEMAEALLKEGIYVVSFSYPVVLEGKARIRTQMSAAHSEEDLRRAAAAFERVGRQLGVIRESVG